ncbi:MAG: PAS domain S-box protein [Alphaproteobacteria bacterium]|nr:PAS domain S-box protein [Alphaproteobacteria bacterium]
MKRISDVCGPATAGCLIVLTLVAVAGVAVTGLAHVSLPAGGGDAPTWILPVLALCAVALVAAVALSWHVTRLAARHRAAANAARIAADKADANYKLLAEALDAIPVGFALYDSHDRLTYYSAPYNRMLGHMGGLTDGMIGLTYDGVLSEFENRLRREFPDRDLTNWKADYLKRYREGQTVDLLWSNGQTVRLSQTPTTSGFTAMIRMDVTDLKRREEEAEDARRRFDQLVNSLSDAVFSTDRNGRFLYLGGAVTQILGYRPDELVGRRTHDIVHPDDRSRLDDCVTQMLRYRGTPVAFPHRALCKDGSVRHVEVRMAAPEKADGLGDNVVATGVVRDVQAEHEMAERLRYELQRLESVVQSSGASIVVVDREMRIVMANRGFIDSQPGRTIEMVVGRPLDEVVRNPINREAFDAWFSAAPSDPIAAIDYESSIADRQGRRRTFHVTANPVRDEDGHVQQVVFLAVDETERRATEMQLFDSARLATVGEMASGVAHEINQPLTIIRFAAESLLEQLQDMPEASLADVTELIDAKLTRIVGQTERAASIIQELKAFARRPEVAPQPFDVPETLRAATQLLREQMRLSHIDLDLDVGSVCAPVLGHASRLQQVVINLIINARDAILGRSAAMEGRPQSGMIAIVARCQPVAGKVVISVEDDGPGMPDNVMARLFEPFFTTKPVGKGTGLGLSVSYQIVRQMGGTIVAENRAEGGARFTITLDSAPTPATAVVAPLPMPSTAA